MIPALQVILVKVIGALALRYVALVVVFVIGRSMGVLISLPVEFSATLDHAPAILRQLILVLLTMPRLLNNIQIIQIVAGQLITVYDSNALWKFLKMK